MILFLCAGSTGITTTNSQNDVPQLQKEDINNEDTIITPTCIQNTEISRQCTSCNSASVTYSNNDCSTSTKIVTDSTCNSLCPVIAPPPVYNPPPVDTCCKHCTTGKPCGDSCININYICHKAPGCAC